MNQKQLYKQRGKNGRVNKLGGWGAIASRQMISELTKQLAEEIDKEIIRQIRKIAIDTNPE